MPLKQRRHEDQEDRKPRRLRDGEEGDGDRYDLYRKPPSSPEAERSVLGAILLLPEVMDDVAPLLRPTMFFDPAHDAIYSVMLRLHAASKPIDVTLVVDGLRNDEMYDDVGGVAYLSELVAETPHAASVVHYAEIVRDMALKRGVIVAATEILRKSFDRQESASELLSYAEGQISNVHAEQAELSIRPIAFVIAGAERRLDKRREFGDGMPTGFREFDEVTCMREGSFIVLAARPGMGKSTFALNIVANVCKRQVGDVLLVSCEMSPEEITDKLISSESGIPINEICDGTLNEIDRGLFRQAASAIADWDLYLDVPRSRRASDIIALARRHRRQKGSLALVVVDYLGLLQPEASEKRMETANEQIAKMTRILKLGAMELKIPILCLAQLSRTGEKTGERPKLHHLRDSGAIEQDADTVWFVHRPHKAEDAERTAESTTAPRDTFAELIVAKQRIGGERMVRLKWQGAVSRFEDFPARKAGEEPLFQDVPDDF